MEFFKKNKEKINYFFLLSTIIDPTIAINKIAIGIPVDSREMLLLVYVVLLIFCCDALLLSSVFEVKLLVEYPLVEVVLSATYNCPVSSSTI